MKNGNFFIGYTDLFYAGGFEPKIERVYNSKTVYNGIFGWGWGNEYEAYLTVTADGSVIVHEYGGGAENRFSPKAFDAKELNAAVDQILQAAKTLGMFGAEAQYKDYRKKLLEDATHRNNEWEKFIAKGLVKPRELSVGTNLFSSRFSYQVITKLINMYIRTSDSGKIEEFDLHGKLKKIKDRNNNYIMLYHKDDGGLEKIVDNFNRKIFVSLNSNGKIIKIQGENKKETIYQYNDKNDLVYSKDAEGNIYKYKYDEKHNMTEIEYSDNKKMQMTYYPPAQYDNIKSVKDKEGTLTEYVYTIDPKDQGHYSIESKITYPSDSKVDSKERTVASKPVISTAKYEYFTKKRADGTEWTQKMISQVESDKTETTYNEHSGLPLLIK
ncbi:MAG: hypothetical protein HY843_06790 [Bdellovibrio sp.]|nr:hypothetical protein [Bdellovibrio sp.]